MCSARFLRLSSVVCLSYEYITVDALYISLIRIYTDFPGMNDPYLESTEQLDHFFPSSLHKIKFHIFQNILKKSIHGLRLFKYNNMCELCDNIQDKDKRGKIVLKKTFVLHEEVIDIFCDKYHIPTIEKCHFIFLVLGFLVQWNVGRLEMIFS